MHVISSVKFDCKICLCDQSVDILSEFHRIKYIYIMGANDAIRSN